ncbi:alkaline phosphatase family protein [Gemmata sp. G18]|uniref:Alkaline phosphatase family protein n=1 Tax=Gemmata palustris TaxID=2822762 RepID=A0ABS5BZX5_9BACT|nr:alkaline phosphatase family protein [Gemmata palustris]MBP3959208.1 alkaline phosphatase family protein [Gemmata palustris]
MPARSSLSRRGFLAAATAAPLIRPSSALARVAPSATKLPQRVCVVLFDGFGPEYYEASPMPTLKAWAKDGFHKQLKAAMPTVTNTQAAGLCCGVHADEHGITGNSYWDAERDEELFMSDPNLLTSATLFQRAARFGVRSALVSAKQKTVSLLKQGTSYAVGSQQPPAEAAKKYGTPPDIYSADVNYWVWNIAIDLIKNQPKFGLLFVHTTDYPMHKFAPEAADSRAHLSKIDSLLKEAAEADPDMAFIIAPDHGMNAKTTVMNLNKALTERGTPVKIAMSAERDQYPRHHGGYGGTAFIYLNSPKDADKVIKSLKDIEGVEDVLTRDEAAKKHRLNPHRIGDLWVTATKRVVFGHSMKEREELPKDYRSHGSAHEQDIPCFIHRYVGKLPDKEAFATNVDMAKFLYRGT